MSQAIRSGLDWGRGLRLTAWIGAGVLLLLPAVAMQFTREVQWGIEDFIVMGTLLAACAGLVDRATRATDDLFYLGGVAVAVGTAFLLVWVNLAVGIIGDGPVNLLFFGVVAVAAVGACLARFRARGMAAAMVVAALAEIGIGLFAWTTRLGFDEPPGAERMLALVFGFAVPWLIAALLLRISAKR